MQHLFHRALQVWIYTYGSGFVSFWSTIPSCCTLFFALFLEILYLPLPNHSSHVFGVNDLHPPSRLFPFPSITCLLPSAIFSFLSFFLHSFYLCFLTTFLSLFFVCTFPFSTYWLLPLCHYFMVPYRILILSPYIFSSFSLLILCCPFPSPMFSCNHFISSFSLPSFLDIYPWQNFFAMLFNILSGFFSSLRFSS